MTASSSSAVSRPLVSVRPDAGARPTGRRRCPQRRRSAASAAGHDDGRRPGPRRTAAHDPARQPDRGRRVARGVPSPYAIATRSTSRLNPADGPMTRPTRLPRRHQAASTTAGWAAQQLRRVGADRAARATGRGHRVDAANGVSTAASAAGVGVGLVVGGRERGRLAGEGEVVVQQDELGVTLAPGVLTARSASSDPPILRATRA